MRTVPTSPPQRFELIRNLRQDEDPQKLPKDGEFHGSFSLAYCHTTSKGKRKERSKVITESGVRITFSEKKGSKGGDDEFDVKGRGTNQFGVFEITGDASKSHLDGDPTYNVELRKRYVGPATPLPSGRDVGGGGGDGGPPKKKKKKSRAGIGKVGPGSGGDGSQVKSSGGSIGAAVSGDGEGSGAFLPPPLTVVP